MPPKPKFTKEEIVEAALEIISQKGAEALTARELGKKLGSSACPIFTACKNMEGLQQEVRTAAMHRFQSYAGKAPSEMPLFKQIGMETVMFALREPMLYKFLFMRENPKAVNFTYVLDTLGTTADICIEAVCRDYGLSLKEARNLFENMWIYTFGIGTLCACGVCRFTSEAISQMLTSEFQALMMLIKAEKENVQ